MNRIDPEVLGRLPLRVAAVENRMEALVASCRKCREERAEHERLVMHELDGWRVTFHEHLGELEQRLNMQLDKIVKNLKCSKPAPRKLRTKKGMCQ